MIIVKFANNHREHTFSIMSLNLRFGLADDGPNDWEHRVKAYPALFRAFPYDFYAFQEANDFQIDFINDCLGNYSHIGQRQPAPNYWQNNVIFYHPAWECVTREHFYLSATPDVPSKFTQSRWPRQCTLGIFKRNRQTLICVNTHFDFDPEVQHRSALLIQQRLLNHGLNWPSLLTGDFNASPSSSCYTVLTSETDTWVPFKDTFDPCAQCGTHHGFKGYSNGLPIDWILYRGNLKVRDAQVVTQQFEGRYPSDHFPLIATFDWSSKNK